MREWLENLDISKNNMSEIVNEGIEKHRKGTFHLKVTDESSQPLDGVSVTVSLKKHAFQFGANAFMAGGMENEEKNNAYLNIFKESFNQATIPFFWKDDEPEKGRFRFTKDSEHIFRRPPADYMLEWCEEAGVEPKGHNLIWNSQFASLPKWLSREPEEMWKYAMRRMKRIAELYADKIPVFDVVNEFLIRGADNVPVDYPIEAFRRADLLFPNTKLIANETRIWDFKYDASRLYQYINWLKSNQLRVDGIGLQCHLFERREELQKVRGKNELCAEHMIKTLDFYATLGKDIHISEITVPSYPLDGNDEDDQAQIAENLYKIWFSSEKVKSIVWWNLVDGYAFSRPNWDENYYGGGLFRKDLSPKPAYEAIKHLITKEWQTNEQLVTNEKGSAAFSGFYGTYNVTVSKNGMTKSLETNFRDGKRFYTLSF
ncbi:MAG: glycoside hydrolase family 10 [Paenibacillaceae bacterium]|jgi:GH35 family endo-1,4-beta-xylanase|nr:glycoside hydrolase family 10 [Paenibacillaceae bacterium]